MRIRKTITSYRVEVSCEGYPTVVYEIFGGTPSTSKEDAYWRYSTEYCVPDFGEAPPIVASVLD